MLGRESGPVEGQKPVRVSTRAEVSEAMSGKLHKAREDYVAELDRSLRRAADVLSRRPEVKRISVFGSYARGRRDLLTDLDLLVVMDTVAPFVDRLKTVYSLLNLPVDVDILCYTPDEFATMKESGFLRKALSEEKVLYESQ